MSLTVLRLTAVWALRVLLGLFFVFVGLLKFRSDPQSAWVAVFERIGIGSWFRILTGTIEVLGGVGLLVPRLNHLSLVALGLTMTGAFLAHLFVLGLSPQTGLVVGLFAALLTLGWLNRKRVLHQ